MTYHVVHCGTGNVGRYALESVINNPELELVGHFSAILPRSERMRAN